MARSAVSRTGNRTSRPASKHVAEIDDHLVDLLNRSTQELRLAWRELHRTELICGKAQRETCEPRTRRLGVPCLKVIMMAGSMARRWIGRST